MSLVNFLTKAKESAVEITAVEDVSTDAFITAISDLDAKTVNKLSVTDEQAFAIKKAVYEYKEEIKLGKFIPTTEKLHTIVMWFRISREEAFVLVPEKPAKAARKPSTRKKKEVPVIGDLM